MEIINAFLTGLCYFFLILSPKDVFSLLLEREEQRERNIGAREKHRLVASRVYAQARGRTQNLSVTG